MEKVQKCKIKKQVYAKNENTNGKCEKISN